MDQTAGDATETIEPGILRVLAPNPSPMTHLGTNSYVVGDETVAVIDPGPTSTSHLAALLSAINGRPVAAILVTHAHRDHSEGCVPLAVATGARVLGFGPASAGRTEFMERLASAGLIGGGEGADLGFSPDRQLVDREQIAVGVLQLTALHTPGHFAGHLSFALDDVIFTGDLVMGWASTLISPPDGDLGSYFSSMDRLGAMKPRRMLPGHGPMIDAPDRRVAELIAHRHSRTKAILDALGTEPRSLHAITADVYQDTPEALLPAARRNAFAHLVELVRTSRVAALPRLAPNAGFCLR